MEVTFSVDFGLATLCMFCAEFFVESTLSAPGVLKPVFVLPARPPG